MAFADACLSGEDRNNYGGVAAHAADSAIPHFKVVSVIVNPVSANYHFLDAAVRLTHDV